jgi:hypothetical protein
VGTNQKDEADVAQNNDGLEAFSKGKQHIRRGKDHKQRLQAIKGSRTRMTPPISLRDNHADHLNMRSVADVKRGIFCVSIVEIASNGSDKDKTCIYGPP